MDQQTILPPKCGNDGNDEDTGPVNDGMDRMLAIWHWPTRNRRLNTRKVWMGTTQNKLGTMIVKPCSNGPTRTIKTTTATTTATKAGNKGNNVARTRMVHSNFSCHNHRINNSKMGRSMMWNRVVAITTMPSPTIHACCSMSVMGANPAMIKSLSQRLGTWTISCAWPKKPVCHPYW